MVRFISTALIIIGGAGFLSGFLVATGFVEFSETLEMPNSDVSGIKITSAGDILIASQFLGRIQKYTENGKFLKGWTVKANGGAYCLEPRGEKILVHIARGNTTDEYDLSGKLLSSVSWHDDGSGNWPCKAGNQLLSYEFDWNGIRIMKSTESSEVVFIARRGWHYLMPGPFYSWAIFAFGVVLRAIWILQNRRGRDRGK